MDALAPLTDGQRALADQRAQCSIAAAEVLGRRAAGSEAFVSIRDTRAAASQAGTPLPDFDAERSMVRDAGFGRFKTSGLLGDWETLVNGTHEAARWHRDRIDLVAVARVSLAFCLAGRPSDHPIAALLILSRDIVTDDVHLEQTAPTYRRLLDGWRGILESPA